MPTQKETITFKGQEREYTILDRDTYEVSPRWFIIYNNREVYVSDEVPQEFRPHMVFHELYEFETLPLNKEGRCLEALAQELSQVPEDQKPRYVPFRRDVFQSLVDYLESQNHPLLPEARKSLDYLNKILSN